jgi:hypothetical protein
MSAIRCGFGLGNRVAAIANALSRAEKIAFVWRVNKHCPLGHEVVFPDGIEGVEFITDAPPALATVWHGRRCHEWFAAADRRAANLAYGRIMAAMDGTAWGSHQLGVCARFHRHPSTTPEQMAEHVRAIAGRLGERRVFLLADTRRAELASLLHDLCVTMPSAPELAEDLQRGPEHALAFLDDWKTLLACPHIAAADGPTSLLHPARAAGREIHYPT